MLFVKKASIMIKKHRFVIIVKFNIVVYATEQAINAVNAIMDINLFKIA